MCMCLCVCPAEGKTIPPHDMSGPIVMLARPLVRGLKTFIPHLAANVIASACRRYRRLT